MVVDFARQMLFARLITGRRKKKIRIPSRAPSLDAGAGIRHKPFSRAYAALVRRKAFSALLVVGDIRWFRRQPAI